MNTETTLLRVQIAFMRNSTVRIDLYIFISKPLLLVAMDEPGWFSRYSDCRLRAGRQRSRGSIPSRSKIFSLLYIVQTGSEIHPDSYPVGPGIERPGREADHASPSSAEVKSGGTIPPLPHMPSSHGA
jgi:hypothetical protein